jgi:uncharacterized membrane protein YphA (DoxX/SURF4 family)
MDAGLLMARVIVGALMAAHGSQKLFGWFRGYGVAGTGGFFEKLGFRPGRSLPRSPVSPNRVAARCSRWACASPSPPRSSCPS